MKAETTPRTFAENYVELNVREVNGLAREHLAPQIKDRRFKAALAILLEKAIVAWEGNGTKA